MSRRVLIAIIVVGSVALTHCELGQNVKSPPSTSEGTSVQATPTPGASSQIILPGGRRVAVEVVTNDEDRAQGLMNRTSLDSGKGMLFIFASSGEHSFWMKNTLIPLDIIWIDEQRRVVAMHQNVPPCRVDPCPSYAPGAAARYVLELGGGEATAFGLKQGDVVDFENIDATVAR